MAKIVRISRDEANRRLADVPDEKRFWCHDGRLIKNLRELGSALNDMSAETFGHHSGQARSDFANWVREVVGDEKLAKDLARAKSPGQAGKAVAERIAFLESKL